MLWLAIHLPKLALEALARSAEQEQQAFAVLEQARISKVVACNPTACLAGIHPGMPLTVAQALAPSLLWQMHRPRLVQQALQQLLTRQQLLLRGEPTLVTQRAACGFGDQGFDPISLRQLDCAAHSCSAQQQRP